MLIRCRFAAAVAACATMTGAAMAASPQLAAASARPHAPVTRLALTGAQQRQLVRLYAAYRHIPADDIATILPGSVRGARITRTGVDWASLGLLPSAHAPRAVQTGFQDGGGSGIFTRAPGGMWKVTGLGGEPFGCATAIPAPVRQAWHLAGCAASGSPPPAPARSADGTMSGLANLALKQVGVSDTPPDPSGEEATDCDPYTAIENPAAPTAGCGVDPTFHIQDAAEFWCADFTKWVWTHAGVTSGLGTLSPQSATWYTWGKDHGESMPENQDPSTAQVGDAVVFYPGTTPNGTYADHVGIVVKVNSDGTLDLVDGDFFGDGTYSVQYNETTADLYTWADEVFGHSDEDWIFVSPQLAGSGGGVSAASPAVYNPGSSHLEVYGTGTSGALEESYYRTGTGPGTGWTTWQPVDPTGASVTGVPAAIYDPINGNLEVYAATTKGQLAEYYWNSTTGWHTANLKGAITASPTAIYNKTSGNLEVYAHSTSGKLAEIYYNGTAWSKWQQPHAATAITSSPAAVYDPISSNLEVYAATTSGKLAEFYWNTTGWHTTTITSFSPLVSSKPSAIYDPATNYLEVYAQTQSGQLAEFYWNTSWHHANLKGAITTSPAAVYNQANDNLEVYARGNGGTLNEIYHTASGWSKWQITKATITGSPYAVYDTSTGNLEVYWLTGHTVSERYWNTTGWHTANLHGNLSAL